MFWLINLQSSNTRCQATVSYLLALKKRRREAPDGSSFYVGSGLLERRRVTDGGDRRFNVVIQKTSAIGVGGKVGQGKEKLGNVGAFKRLVLLLRPVTNRSGSGVDATPLTQLTLYG